MKYLCQFFLVDLKDLHFFEHWISFTGEVHYFNKNIPSSIITGENGQKKSGELIFTGIILIYRIGFFNFSSPIQQIYLSHLQNLFWDHIPAFF